MLYQIRKGGRFTPHRRLAPPYRATCNFKQYMWHMCLLETVLFGKTDSRWNKHLDSDLEYIKTYFVVRYVSSLSFNIIMVTCLYSLTTPPSRPLHIPCTIFQQNGSLLAAGDPQGWGKEVLPPAPFWGTPNLQKEGKCRTCAWSMRCVSVLHSLVRYVDHPPLLLSKAMYPPLVSR